MAGVSAPRLVDGLADITAIRDIELLEFSVLKTLHGFIQAEGIRLLKLNNQGQARKEIVFGERFCQVRDEDIAVPDQVKALIEIMDDSDGRTQTVRDGGLVTTIDLLFRTRVNKTYLLITTKKELNKHDAYLIRGMLHVCANFYDLLKHSQTDPLTGLASRRTFDATIGKIFEFSPSPGIAVEQERRAEAVPGYWLAMLDVDHFKSINDRFGHLYGDEVLILLAQMVKAHFREDDLVFRFGGEEFVVIARCPDYEACHAALERLRQIIETRDFPQVGRVTLSIGVTQMKRDIFSATLVDYADQALYHSKKAGRNRITFFEDMVRDGIAKFEQIETDEVTFF